MSEDGLTAREIEYINGREEKGLYAVSGGFGGPGVVSSATLSHSNHSIGRCQAR